MNSLCQVCKIKPAMCEQIKNGKRIFKCVLCREGRQALFAAAAQQVKTVKRLARTRRI